MTPTLHYWIPIVVFGLMTAVDSSVSREWFPWAYAAKAAAVTAALFLWRAPLADIKFSTRVLLPSIVVGFIVFVLWIGVDKMVPYPHLGMRTGFDPNGLSDQSGWFFFLALRFYGLVLMVPVMEELFWRSFLLRYLTQHDFRSLPMGDFSAFALAVVTAVSAMAHPEWLVAVIASLAYALWLRRTRSLFAAIVAHATTNLALGIYVLRTGEWHYW